MPSTRSASKAKKASSSATLAESEEEVELNDGLQVCRATMFSILVGLNTFQSHLSALQRGIQKLKKTEEDLLRKNRRLEQEINRLHNEADVSIQPSPVKSRGKGNPLLHVKVKELELEVRRLKKVTRFTWTTGFVLTLLGIRLALWTARR